MKRRVITILIALLSVSIIGIMVVQLMWIRNAIRVKEQLFMLNASEALQSAVKRLETLHDVTIINRMAFPDSVFWINKDRILSNTPQEVVSRRLQTIRFDRSAPGNNLAEMEILFKADSLKNIDFRFSENTNSQEFVRSPENKKTEEIIVMRAGPSGHFDSIMRSGLRRLDSLSVVLDTVAGRQAMVPQVHFRATNLRNLTRRAMSEIITLDRPEINPVILEKTLAEEFLNRNIPIEFEYGVFRDSTLLLSSERADTVALQSSGLKTALFPSSLFRRNQNLAVYFPEREGFIYRSMSWLMAASLIFSAIVTVTFSLSVFFLLRQKKISEMKSDFINNMTHEFKTPIATIAVAADSLQNEKVLNDPEMIRYFSGMIKKENHRMNRQVEDILTIARLEKKELEFKWDTFDIHEMLRESIEAIQVHVSERGGQILSVFEAIRPMVNSDRKHLTHAIMNLLDNANKYTSDIPRIVVSTKDTDSGVLLCVTDNGNGMTQQVQDRIFERFYRQPSGNIHNIKGFGLGLNYAKAVIEASGGRISVHSEPGKGSRFEVFLPRDDQFLK
jgi:two-component system, OmpR family, phosphate regulon sensor histidine kinase PhoR